MGVDIHINIISDKGEYIIKDLYNGRNTRWFDNISDHYFDPEYKDFPKKCGIPDNAPEDIKKIYDGVNSKNPDCFGYYGFQHVKIFDFMGWYEDRKPYHKAGWVTKYDAFLYKVKGIIPSEENVGLYNYPIDTTANNVEFIEYIDNSEPSVDIYKTIEVYLYSNETTYAEAYNTIMNGYIVYYFDR